MRRCLRYHLLWQANESAQGPGESQSNQIELPSGTEGWLESTGPAFLYCKADRRIQPDGIRRGFVLRAFFMAQTQDR